MVNMGERGMETEALGSEHAEIGKKHYLLRGYL
jgi:hypothetical protein